MWSEKEIQILEKKYPERGTEIENLDRTKKAISWKAMDLGVEYKGSGSEWSKKEIKILKEKYPKQGASIEELDRATESIHSMASKLEIKCEEKPKTAERTELKCDFCGKKFKLRNSEIRQKREKQDNFFCSRECYKKFRSKNYSGKNHPRYGSSHSKEAIEKMKRNHDYPTGKDHPSYKHGKYSIENKNPEEGRLNELWKQKSKEIKKRDNFTCQICGKKGGYLVTHHIKSWKDYPNLRFENSNLITLCKSCHEKIHSDKLEVKINEL